MFEKIKEWVTLSLDQRHNALIATIIVYMGYELRDQQGLRNAIRKDCETEKIRLQDKVNEILENQIAKYEAEKQKVEDLKTRYNEKFDQAPSSNNTSGSGIRTSEEP